MLSCMRLTQGVFWSLKTKLRGLSPYANYTVFIIIIIAAPRF